MGVVLQKASGVGETWSSQLITDENEFTFIDLKVSK